MTGPAGESGGRLPRDILPSFAEIEVLGARAALGAGLTHGLAEEAGRAARELAMLGVPGCEQLLALLSAIDGRAEAFLVARASTGTWTSAGGAHCAVALGATYSDLVGAGEPVPTIRTGPVHAPLMVLPALIWASEATGCRIVLRGEGLQATVEAGRLSFDCREHTPPHWLPALQIGPGTGLPAGEALTPQARAHRVPDAIWQALGALAARRLVPETALSRSTGAGEIGVDAG